MYYLQKLRQRSDILFYRRVNCSKIDSCSWSGIVIPELLTSIRINRSVALALTKIFSPIGVYLQALLSNSVKILWTIKESESIVVICSSKSMINCCCREPAISKNGFIVSKIKTCRLKDFLTSLLAPTSRKHKVIKSSIKFFCRWQACPDGQILASGSTDSSIKLWDVDSSECLQTLLGYRNWVCSVAFSPDGQTIASGG